MQRPTRRPEALLVVNVGDPGKRFRAIAYDLIEASRRLGISSITETRSILWNTLPNTTTLRCHSYLPIVCFPLSSNFVPVREHDRTVCSLLDGWCLCAASALKSASLTVITAQSKHPRGSQWRVLSLDGRCPAPPSSQRGRVGQDPANIRKPDCVSSTLSACRVGFP